MTEDTVTRFPLQWPSGRLRTRYRQSSTFKRARGMLSVWDATQRLQKELARLGSVNEVLSTNVQTRLDGMPRSGTGEPQDPGAAVYFSYKGRAKVLACDQYRRVADNIAAIAAHIEALRRIERYGVGTMEQALEGFKALPPNPDHEWWLVLGVSQYATPEEIDKAFRIKIADAHPDKETGSDNDMVRLNLARAAGKAAHVGV